MPSGTAFGFDEAVNSARKRPSALNASEYASTRTATVSGTDAVRGRFTILVTPRFRSRKYTPFVVLLVPGARFIARLLKATIQPSSLIAGCVEAALAVNTPFDLTLINVVVSVCRSRRNTSETRFVSLGTRSEAVLSKATKRPSGVITAFEELSLPAPEPKRFTLTRVVFPLTTSRRKMSLALFVSLVTRLLAQLSKTTN